MVNTTEGNEQFIYSGGIVYSDSNKYAELVRENDNEVLYVLEFSSDRISEKDFITDIKKIHPNKEVKLMYSNFTMKNGIVYLNNDEYARHYALNYSTVEGKETYEVVYVLSEISGSQYIKDFTQYINTRKPLWKVTVITRNSISFN